MGANRSYLENFLTKEVRGIENELIGLKATQNYGTGQITPRTSSSVPIASEVNSLGFHEISVLVTFTGANKNKTARGSLYGNVSIEDSRLQTYYYSSIIVQMSSNQAKNVLRWVVNGYCGRIPVPGGSGTVSDLPTTSPFTSIMVVDANMGGIVTYERI